MPIEPEKEEYLIYRCQKCNSVAGRVTPQAVEKDGLTAALFDLGIDHRWVVTEEKILCPQHAEEEKSKAFHRVQTGLRFDNDWELDVLESWARSRKDSDEQKALIVELLMYIRELKKAANAKIREMET